MSGIHYPKIEVSAPSPCAFKRHLQTTNVNDILYILCCFYRYWHRICTDKTANNLKKIKSNFKKTKNAF